MKSWIIEPRDTLVLRDGAPADGVMRTLGFPWPSSTTGVMRSQAGLGPDGAFDVGRRNDVLEFDVVGPLLARLDEGGDVDELYVPAPRDCVWHRLEDEERPARGPAPTGAPAAERIEVAYREPVERRRLAPVAPPPNVWMNLPEGLGLVGPVVGFDELPSTKAATGPAFWPWAALEAWLTSPSTGPDGLDGGLTALPREVRTHVKIDPSSSTASDGDLFSTESLRFTTHDQRLALWVGADVEVADGLVRLGGEGRLSMLRASKRGAPAMPEGLKEALRGQQQLRVILLTPGVFEAGALPDGARWNARVTAAVVDRPLAHSGWDMTTNAPKPSRRLVPAGSVYWLEVEDALAWAEEHWMRCLSDDVQDARDGFGLAVMGVA